MKYWINLIIIVILMVGCSTSRKTITFEKVKKGEQLEKAQEVTIEQFFQIWMSNKMEKLDFNYCHELYKDNKYTYFGRNILKGVKLIPNLYKINTDSVAVKFEDYKKIDAVKIRNEFWIKVVPKSDEEIFDMPPCQSSTCSSKFYYNLIGKKILITLELSVECKKGIFQGKKIEIMKKTYKGYYDMNDMKIVPNQ